MKFMTHARKYGARIIAGGSALASSSAFAAYTMPAAVNTGAADIIDAVSQYEALIWTIIIPITIAFLAIKIFKRFFAKA